MSYDLTPKNAEAGDFRFGAFSFPVLLEACGYLFSVVSSGGRWFVARGIDERMGDDYPLLLSNDGFSVTEEEAKIMARIAKNFVAIQRLLPEENSTNDMRSQSKITRDSLKEMIDAMHGNAPGPWPVRIRTDFTDKFEQFAEWAPKSGGFQIW